MSSQRKNVTQPDDLWAAIDEQMNRDGVKNLSRWLGECAAANLDADLAEGLSDRPTVGKRPKPKDQDR